MRIVFMGTPDFAVPCLQKLIDNNYDVAAVFTQPDKKRAENNFLHPRPLKFWHRKTIFPFISLIL